MKRILPLLLLTILMGCKKDQDKVTDVKKNDSAALADSSHVAEISNPGFAAPFIVNPLDVVPAKGKAVFTEDGKTVFYFDQNENKGKIRIDGKDWELNSYDFNENNYTLSGAEIKIEATDGEFRDQTGDCVYGVFPEVKVTLNGKVLNMNNISVQDCPDY